jgi:lipopolysaccharide transport system permease protein
MKPKPTMPNEDSSAAARCAKAEHMTMYRANQRHEVSWLATWITMVLNTWGARELIWQLIKRDVTAQYKKSFIGMSWVLAGPIMAIVPWLFATHVKLYNPGELAVPLLVYLIVGRSMWSLFTGFYANGASTMGAGGALMLQVSFPHEAMLVKQLLVGLFGFLLSFVVTLVVMFQQGVYLTWGALFFPLSILPLFWLGASMGLIVTMVRVVAYDLNRVIGILWGFAMWTTPLLYSDKLPNPLIQSIIKYNPLTYLVCSSRDFLLTGSCYKERWDLYLICSGVSFILFLVSMRLFYVSEHKLVERMV